MNTPLLPSFEFVEAPAPQFAPLAAFEICDESVRLGLSDSGSIEVSREGINVLAPDALGYQRTIDRLGQWAQAQWLATQGLRVMRGAVVARQGKAIALIGGARCGASVLALVLSRRGWGLVSDGLVVMDNHGILRALEPSVTLDAQATIGLPEDVRITKLTTGRDRVKVSTMSHGDAKLGAYVVIRVLQSLNQLDFERVPFHADTRSALEGYQIASLLDTELLSLPIVEATTWRIARPVVSPNPHSYTPPALAALLTSALDSEVG
jgi:hypothetical protein